MFLQNCGCFVNNFELSVNASLSQDLIVQQNNFGFFTKIGAAAHIAQNKQLLKCTKLHVLG